MDVKFCPQCRCTTWHVDGVCEWIDTHKEAEEKNERPAYRSSALGK
jgi:hypothetical protein